MEAIMIRFVATGIMIAALSGCAQQSGESTASVPATAVAFNVAGAPTVEFNVPDMMCPTSCVAKTREILSQQPGAKDVLVDFETKTAIVAVEPDKFDAGQAIAALVDHGFDHSAVKSDSNKSEPGQTATAPDQPTATNHAG
jgi:copper chaperone CopZ